MNVGIIKRTLDLIEKIECLYEMNVKKDCWFYKNVLNQLKENILNKEINKNLNFIKEVNLYINDLKINKLDIKIRKFLYSNKSLLNSEDSLINWFEKVKNLEKEYDGYEELIENLPQININEIGFVPIMLFLEKCLSLVNYIGNGDFLLMKYNNNIFMLGHNELTKICRGIVVDINSKEIISFPFHKFFNLNEVEETQEHLIKEIIEKANHKLALRKEDGSTICCTKLYDGEILITTNGSFDNDQITKAKELLSNKYNYFLKNMDKGKSYIFEIIYPENRIVVDYFNKEIMYLLAVRDLNNYRLLKYPEVVEISNKLKLDVVENVEFISLDDFINISKNSTDNNFEGWVLRVITDEQDIMFKLKLVNYVLRHKTKFSNINPYKIYKLKCSNSLDDIIANSEGEELERILKAIDKLNYIESVIQAEIDAECKKIYEKFNINSTNFREYRNGGRDKEGFNNFLDCIKYLSSIKNTTHPLIIKGINNYLGGKLFEDFLYYGRHKIFRSYLVERRFLNIEDLDE